MQNTGKILHKVFKVAVNEILQALTILGESESEVYFCIPEPKNFTEETILS